VAGLAHVADAVLSNLHTVLFAAVALKATVAVVLVVDFGGELVIVTLTEAEECACARAGPRTPTISRQSARMMAREIRLVLRG
jgi:hypothetical protein